MKPYEEHLMSTDTSQIAQTTSQQHSINPLSKKSTVPVWGGIATIIVVTMILISLYYLNIISRDWLNRIVMIINMAIGLLFAPAVLDTTGFFGKVIPKLERLTGQAYNLSNAFLPSISRLFKLLTGNKGTRFIPLLGCSIISWVIFTIVIQAGILPLLFLLVFLYPVALILGILDLVYHLISRRRVKIFNIIVAILIYPFLFPVFIIGIPLLFILRSTLKVIRIISIGLHGTFSEREEFRSALIKWGILIFIVGNLLQFIASF
jgi:hypothetical protein